MCDLRSSSQLSVLNLGSNKTTVLALHCRVSEASNICMVVCESQVSCVGILGLVAKGNKS